MAHLQKRRSSEQRSLQDRNFDLLESHLDTISPNVLDEGHVLRNEVDFELMDW